MSHANKHPWPREPISAPTYQLKTKLGNPFIRAISDGVVSVQGGIPHNTEQGAEGALTINSVVYSVQAHFHKWPDGRYHAGPETSGSGHGWSERLGYNPNEPRLSRRGSFKDASTAAVRQARRVLEDAVNEWVAKHDDLILAGETRKRAEDAHRLATQLDKAEANTATLRANLDACIKGGEYRAYPL